MDIKEKEWEGVDWIYMSPDMIQLWNLVNTVMKLWVPKKKAANFWDN
jgi:hypothetical protein